MKQLPRAHEVLPKNEKDMIDAHAMKNLFLKRLTEMDSKRN